MIREMDQERKNAVCVLSRILPWIWLLMTFLLYLLFLDRYSIHNIDSDMSSEMVLSSLLAREGGILSKNWYYSTELRVVNTQLVFSFFLRLFSDWHLVRMWSSAVLMLIMLASFYYLCFQAGCRKYFPMAASVLLMPFSKDYYQFVMLGLYYIPHISFSFLSLGLIFHFAGAKKRRERAAVSALSFLTAMLAAMGGIRQIIVMYLPAAFAAAVNLFVIVRADVLSLPEKVTEQERAERKSRALAYCTVCFFLLTGSAAGLLINSKLLAARYTFSHFSRLSWVEFTWEGIVDFLRSFFAFWGYREDLVRSGALVTNGICFLLAGLFLLAAAGTVRRFKHNEQSFIMRTLLAGMGCLVLLYTFTDMKYKSRYILPVLILSVPYWTTAVKAVCIQTDKRYAKHLRKLGVVLVACVLISSLFVYRHWAKVDKTGDLILVADQMVRENYQTGYSTFWRANVLTELSNGKIDMYDWLDNNSNKDLEDVDTLYCWLQVKQHRQHPQGKVFLLFTKEEFKRFTLCKSLSKEDASYTAGRFIVFGFDDYEAMTKALSKADAAGQGEAR